jgi:hypothetical protein
MTGPIRTTRKPTALAPGDRVKERGRIGLDVVTPTSAAFEEVSRYRHNPRRGSVISLVTRPDRAGRRCTYVNVLWDGYSTPSLHSLSRLLAVDSQELL